MQKINKVKNIVIVGGGTSGWLAAAYISHNKPHYNITVIDKEVSTPVGVGEGTLLGFQNFMFNCGFFPADWFFEIDATFKSAIHFPGWGKNGSDVWHPFLFPARCSGPEIKLFDVWSADQSYDFKKYCLGLHELSTDYKKVDADQINMGNYAYHVDCGKLVKLIKEKIVGIRNVTLINSEVVDIVRNGADIEQLILKNQQTVSADLFLDCTGFKHLLHDCPERVDVSDRLFCNTAIAGHIPYQDIDKELNPYVVSEAVDHGWIWNIPVQTRIGSGLVFNRSITDIEEAKDYFLDYWNHRTTKDKLKVIDWTPYYNNNPWHGNTVSIGLSAGFIEPLESTGVALIITGIEQMMFRLGSDYYSDGDITVYNNIYSAYFEDCVDFVNMHYSTVDKDTKFWNWVKEKYTPNERFKFYAENLESNIDPLVTAGQGYIFSGNNWICWLIQLGFPMGCKISLTDEQVKNIMTAHNLEEQGKMAQGILHREYIDNIKQYRR
jgi:hypothetical protein